MALRNYLLLGFLMLCGFVVVGQLYITIPLTSDIASSFGVAPGSATLAGSAFGFGYAAGFLIFGPLSDRYGRKRVILAGLLATALITVVVGAMHSFGLLLAARVAQGLAASAFPPAALSLVAEELPASHRPLGISLMSFAFLGAAPIAQFFAGEVGDLALMMFIVAPLYVIGAAGLQFAAKGGRTALPAATPGTGAKSGFGTLLTNPAIVSGWLAAFTVLFGFVYFHAAAHAQNGGLGIDLQSLRLIGLPPLLLTLAAASVTRKFGAPTTARIGLIVMVGAFAVSAAGTASAVLAASFVLSVGVALAVPGLIATVAGQAGNENRGLALAIYSFTMFIGASLAAPATQVLVSRGVSQIWVLPALLLVGAVFTITASIRRKTLSPTSTSS